MSQNQIIKNSRIKQETVSNELYFQSLLEQAALAGVLSEAASETIQLDCLALLTKKTNRYHSGESTSVSVETAQNLLTSIMFTIGVELKTYDTPDEAIEAVKRDGVEPVYQKGFQRIQEMTAQTKRLHTTILKQLLQSKNEFYSSTVIDSINGFFKLYYPEFAAQEIHITADYPVYPVMERLLGIEFIQKYLECIYYENLFCTIFTTEVVHHLLCGYEKHYKGLLFNIYEPVLSAALGCILSGGDVLRLEMTEDAETLLGTLFKGRTKAEIETILTKAVEQLCELLELQGSLKRYILKSLPKLAASVEGAASLNRLNSLFIKPRYPGNQSKVSVSFGEKMEDKKYRKVLEEIMQCRYIEDKMALIKSDIHSLADLEDILLDAELTEKEILTILRELSSEEREALRKRHPLPSVSDRYGLREGEVLLCECLNRFKKS